MEAGPPSSRNGVTSRLRSEDLVNLLGAMADLTAIITICKKYGNDLLLLFFTLLIFLNYLERIFWQMEKIRSCSENRIQRAS